MSVIIQKKNIHGYLDTIYPEKIVCVSGSYQLQNDTICNLCTSIPVIYKITLDNNTGLFRQIYICYDCSKNTHLVQNNIHHGIENIFQSQENTYPD